MPLSKCLRKNSKTNSLQSNIQPAILPAPDMTEKGEMPGSEISSIVDMNSDYENPQIVTAEQIQEARKRLEPFMSETPCEKSRLCDLYEMDLWMKKEYMQYTGSFKERVARNAILQLKEGEAKNGIVVSSAGNHGISVSFVGMQMDIPVIVVMPTTTPLTNIQRCRQYGSTVYINGSNMVEAKRIALHMAEEKDMYYLSGYDHPAGIAGAGVIGLEIMEQVPNVDVVVVPIGGGGCFAGIAVAIKSINPDVQIIGVETINSASWSNAIKEGKPVMTEMGPTLADGLSVAKVGANAFESAAKLETKHILVDECDIAIAMLRMAEVDKVVVEGCGACALAAVSSGQMDEYLGKRIVLVISGGNIDMLTHSKCLERGLVCDHRLIRVVMTVSDRPGGVLKIFEIIASTGASIKDFSYDKIFPISDVHGVEVQVVMEVRDKDHENDLIQQLRAHNPGLIYPVQYAQSGALQENVVTEGVGDVRDVVDVKKAPKPAASKERPPTVQQSRMGEPAMVQQAPKGEPKNSEECPAAIKVIPPPPTQQQLAQRHILGDQNQQIPRASDQSFMPSTGTGGTSRWMCSPGQPSEPSSRHVPPSRHEPPSRASIIQSCPCNIVSSKEMHVRVRIIPKTQAGKQESKIKPPLPEVPTELESDSQKQSPEEQTGTQQQSNAQSKTEPPTDWTLPEEPSAPEEPQVPAEPQVPKEPPVPEIPKTEAQQESDAQNRKEPRLSTDSKKSKKECAAKKGEKRVKDKEADANKKGTKPGHEMVMDINDEAVTKQHRDSNASKNTNSSQDSNSSQDTNASQETKEKSRKSSTSDSENSADTKPPVKIEQKVVPPEPKFEPKLPSREPSDLKPKITQGAQTAHESPRKPSYDRESLLPI